MVDPQSLLNIAMAEAIMGFCGIVWIIGYLIYRIVKWFTDKPLE